ncbi:MAG: recombination-associated protein RdgC [Gammaproteobacteria bacterium]|jgi:recombination associated protein RdgC|nr:recombination-associated protein RdgC [Gammaproteobacteria bacterium]MBU0773292.1 recombination-associated protein RdgC [Gammaproteobacteria bacterium]MBU0856062.1 recombination-associated protein RdgC [Gammaproteobacteria bacterium]MBU1848567.1 recombination-associated protein RdgC [Gammaproteobacteria bacterium]
MWFKNLQIYHLAAPFTLTHEQLDEKLAAQAFQPGSSVEMQRMGWISPRDNGVLVHAVAGQMMIALRTEKKLLPASVINQVAKARAQEIEERQGYKPGRKEMRELKDTVTNELLPRAFAVWRDTRVWIDPVRGRIVVDAAASAKGDEVMQLLNESVENLGARPLQTRESPVAAMTSWLAADEAPAGFSVDQDTELRSSTQSKATVRYVRHALDAADLRRHIEAGKQCTRLAMTWMDRVSFTLTETLAIKRVTPLDVLTEKEDGSGDEAERFDTDFALMSGELGRLIDHLTETLGGRQD